MDEGRQPPFQLGASQHNAVGAALAAQTDIGPEANDLPLVVPAGVRLAQPDDVPQVEFDDSCASNS
jgi:hypothetical protein